MKVVHSIHPDIIRIRVIGTLVHRCLQNISIWWHEQRYWAGKDDRTCQRWTTKAVMYNIVMWSLTAAEMPSVEARSLNSFVVGLSLPVQTAGCE